MKRLQDFACEAVLVKPTGPAVYRQELDDPFIDHPMFRGCQVGSAIDLGGGVLYRIIRIEKHGLLEVEKIWDLANVGRMIRAAFRRWIADLGYLFLQIGDALLKWAEKR